LKDTFQKVTSHLPGGPGGPTAPSLPGSPAGPAGPMIAAPGGPSLETRHDIETIDANSAYLVVLKCI
jgi:hypothetical protein